MNRLLELEKEIFGKQRSIQKSETTITINYQRITETENSTIGEFSIEGTNISGYMLEPAGPSTTDSGTDRRIPAGTYNLDWHNGTRFQDVIIIYNDQVPRSRAILIHPGNKPEDTEGCFLPGSSYSEDWVSSSRATLKKIKDYLKTHGIANARLVIKEIEVSEGQWLQRSMSIAKDGGSYAMGYFRPNVSRALGENPQPGHYYDIEGNFLGSEGSSSNVYVADSVEQIPMTSGNGATGFVNLYRNPHKLIDPSPLRYTPVEGENYITHDDFKRLAYIISHEDAGTFESAAATAQTIFNAVAYRKKQNVIGTARELVDGNYSSVGAGSLNESASLTTKDKNARKGLIHALIGGTDYSNGAVLWDGIDFLIKGTTHSKFSLYGAILEETHYNTMKGAYKWPVKYRSVDYPAPSSTFSFSGGVMSHPATDATNLDRILLKSNTVVNESVFWVPNEGDPANAGYNWKYLLWY